MSLNPVRTDIDVDTIAFAIARNQVGAKLPVQEVLQDLGMTPDEFLKLADNALFKQKVKSFAKELSENGASFQMKARIQAEEMLKLNWRLAHDPDTPAATAAKIVENTVRWAGLEPKPTQTAGAQAGAGFQIVFNIPAVPEKAPQQAVIDVIPTQVEEK